MGGVMIGHRLAVSPLGPRAGLRGGLRSWDQAQQRPIQAAQSPFQAEIAPAKAWSPRGEGEVILVIADAPEGPYPGQGWILAEGKEWEGEGLNYSQLNARGKEQKRDRKRVKEER